MQKYDFPLYYTNQKINLVTKNKEPEQKACKINILYIIYLKKKQTIIRLPLIINTVFCLLRTIVAWFNKKKYSDSKIFTLSLFTFLLFIIIIIIINISFLRWELSKNWLQSYSPKTGQICQGYDVLGWQTINCIYSTRTVTKMRRSHAHTLLSQVWYLFTLFQLQVCLRVCLKEKS